MIQFKIYERLRQLFFKRGYLEWLSDKTGQNVKNHVIGNYRSS